MMMALGGHQAPICLGELWVDLSSRVGGEHGSARLMRSFPLAVILLPGTLCTAAVSSSGKRPQKPRRWRSDRNLPASWMTPARRARGAGRRRGWCFAGHRLAAARNTASRCVSHKKECRAAQSCGAPTRFPQRLHLHSTKSTWWRCSLRACLAGRSRIPSTSASTKGPECGLIATRVLRR